MQDRWSEEITMKLTANQLRDIILEEIKNSSSKKKKLSEAITRITEDEVAAWKAGDWGYVSGDEVGPPEHDHEEFLHGHESGHPQDDEGYMVKSRMVSMKMMAEDICKLLDAQDQLPGWAQDHVAVAHENLQQVHGYLMGDSKLGAIQEGHSRITSKELEEWSLGNWGFLDDSEDLQSKDD